MTEKDINFTDIASAQTCLSINSKKMNILLFMFFIPTVTFNIWLAMFSNIDDILCLVVIVAIFPVILFASRKFSRYSKYAHAAADYLIEKKQ